ncbi:MAG: hypothetical protein Q8M34_02730 [Thermodesulfovibrionales bacterium]|nr:hypothetical protein [Thermodesulfovibrionales bacterium]
MKRLILGLITVLILSVPASADIVLTLKNGNTLKWKNYTEENSQYCTQKDYGKICISTDTIVSTKETEIKEEISEGDKIIIVMPSRSKEEIEKEMAERQTELKKREEGEKIEEAKKKEAEEKERLMKIEEEKAEAARRSAKAAEDYNRLIKIQHYDNMVK